MYEVQHYTVNQEWVNLWTAWDDIEGEQPQTFDSVEEAQAELDKFFNNIHIDILNGDRGCNDSFYRDDFMIVEIDDFVAVAA